MADNNTNAVVSQEKQPENNKLTGFQLHPENINKRGRPLKGYSITETIKDMMDAEPKIKQALGKVILKKALEEQDMTAIKLLWSYMDGMPKLTQEISGPEGEPIIIIRDGNKTK